MPPPSPDDSLSHRVHHVAEWGLVFGLMATFAWTTLGLGGFLAQTMAVAGTAVLGLGALGGILWAVGRPGEPRAFNLAVLLPLPFLLFALGSTLGWAPAEWLAWREWLLWFQMWLVFALVLHFGRSRAHTGLIVGTLALLVIVGAGMAIYQRYSDPGWIMLGRRQAPQYFGRSSGMFGIPNSLAALVELLIPACLALLFSRAVKPGAKIICAWCAALGLLALALTVSRGGWLALALALLLWPLLATRRWGRKIVGALVVIVIVGAGLWVLYHGSDGARQRIDPFLDGRFELSRPQVWRTGIEIWRHDPWFGSGAASFNLVFDQYRPPHFRDIPGWAHNDYLNTLSDYGLVGLTLWIGAGAGLLALGWRGIRRAQRVGTSGADIFGLAKWKLGLGLGLLAFALHLFVDFHTKIPALAYAAAIVMALVLRDEITLHRTVSRVPAWTAGIVLTAVALGLAGKIAWPLYRAEGRRFEARRTIDLYAARKTGDRQAVAAAAQAELTQAVRIDPANGQAWADLAYAIILRSSAPGGNRAWAGHAAELAADQALQRCSINAEFWARKGVALDLQGGRAEAEGCFRRATELAPRKAAWWYAYAHHLAAFPERNGDARQALATCLDLDPHYPRAEALRQQLLTQR